MKVSNPTRNLTSAILINLGDPAHVAGFYLWRGFRNSAVTQAASIAIPIQNQGRNMPAINAANQTVSTVSIN